MNLNKIRNFIWYMFWMKVKELIEKLKECDDVDVVFVCNPTDKTILKDIETVSQYEDDLVYLESN